MPDRGGLSPLGAGTEGASVPARERRVRGSVGQPGGYSSVKCTVTSTQTRTGRPSSVAGL
jgi:hypothetical protein